MHFSRVPVFSVIVYSYMGEYDMKEWEYAMVVCYGMKKMYEDDYE